MREVAGYIRAMAGKGSNGKKCSPALMPIYVGFLWCIVFEVCEASLSVLSAAPHNHFVRLGSGQYSCLILCVMDLKSREGRHILEGRGRTNELLPQTLVNTFNPMLHSSRKWKAAELWWEPRALPPGKETVISSITYLNSVALSAQCRQPSWPYCLAWSWS